MCGVIGIRGAHEAAKIAYLGLHALQHRGQESAGIVAAQGSEHVAHCAMGLVQEAITDDHLTALAGTAAIGHVRYSTAGESMLRNAQPFSVRFHGGALAVAHNGNLTNAAQLREELEGQGAIFQSTTDSEVLVHLLARESEGDLATNVVRALTRVEGAYSIVILVNGVLIAARDPLGFRPLSLGRLPEKSGAYVVASEPVAFDLIGAEAIREIEPGEVLVIDEHGLTRAHVVTPSAAKQTRACIFEHVYFARPDSRLDGRSVYLARKALGAALAREAPVDADIVVPIPDSGAACAVGYAQALGLPLELGLVRSHHVGRTFTEPEQAIRHFGVLLKLNPVRDILAGRRVVLLDDSIVRGTTSRKIVKMVRDAGAREVHLRIASAPVRWPCFYGIDTPNRSELIAAHHSIEEIAHFTKADSIAYLSGSAMHAAVASVAAAQTKPSFCDACFSGNYPVPVCENLRRLPVMNEVVSGDDDRTLN